MIEVIQEKLKNLRTFEEKYNQLREFLQVLILKIIDESGYFKNLAFVGGTALRILYNLKRFSEDLDFCLIDQTHYDFSKMMQDLERKLRLYKNNLLTLLEKRIQKTDFTKVRADIAPFLMDPKEIRFFDKEYFLSLISGKLPGNTSSS